MAHHRDRDLVGRSYALDTNEIVLGRGCDVFGAGVFDEPAISRAHVRLSVSSEGVLRGTDLDSRNGTFVNSGRVDSQTLASGDVVALGTVLLLVTREASAPAVIQTGSLVAQSSDLLAAFRAVEAASGRGPVLFSGESGTGKSALAALLHERRGVGALRRLQGTNSEFDERPRADDTWLIESVEALEPPAQQRLLELLPQLYAANVVLATCSVASVMELRGRLDARLVNRLSRWTVTVPPLRSRRADIIPTALFFGERYRGSPVTLEPELAYALLRHAWPGNLHELEAIVERCVVETPDTEPLGSFPGLKAALLDPPGARELCSAARIPSTASVRLAGDGSWFELPGAQRVDLSRRAVLRRVLAAFVDARVRWPGQPMTIAEVVGRGWPGERMTEKAGANRAYVALATLRKQGLRDLLLRDDDGYCLDPLVAVDVGGTTS